MSQGTALPRSFRRSARVVAPAALALSAALALAGCADTTNAAAPALATASGPAANSAALNAAICAKVESAWTAFVPNEKYVVITRKYADGRVTQTEKFDASAYRRVSVGLYAALTGNREFRYAYDIDVLAASASDVGSDPGQTMTPDQYLALIRQAAAVVSKDCGTTLEVPA